MKEKNGKGGGIVDGLTSADIAKKLKQQIVDPFYDLDEVLSDILYSAKNTNGDVYINGKLVNEEFWTLSYSHPKVVVIEYAEDKGFLMIVYEELNRKLYILDTVEEVQF